MTPHDSLERLAASSDWLPPGWQARFYGTVTSTQDHARAAAAAGAPGRTIFVADHQAQGRGRHGRRWSAPPGTALLVSILFRQQGTAAAPWHYTTVASLALTDAIRSVAPTVNPTVKWPNDVMLGQQKVAGVLAESASNGRQLVVIVGIGVNVRMDAMQLAEVGPMATSIREVVGRDIDRGELLEALVEHVHAWIDRPTSEQHATWQARLWGRHQRVRVRGLDEFDGLNGLPGQDQDIEVVVLGIDTDGALRVQLSNGEQARTFTAEILL